MSSNFSSATSEELPICDDCGVAYLGPPYYTFDGEGCIFTEVDPDTGISVEKDHPCTENMCPECSGPYLEPDIDGDERRPPDPQKAYFITTANGERTWFADDEAHARDQHMDEFGGDPRETIISIRTE